jgi:hypothetical protein
LLRRDPLIADWSTDARNQPLEGHVDAFDLDPGRLLVEEVVQLPLRELRDRLVGVDEPAATVDAANQPFIV